MWPVLLSAGALAQEVRLLKPCDLGRWKVPSGHYSGITPIGGGRYAVVSDQEPRDGFFVFRIVQDVHTGQVAEVAFEGFRGTDATLKGGRDAEGVAFTPHDSLVWVSGEADQRIMAHRTDGMKAGRELAVPSVMQRASIVPNYGFEALCFDGAAGLFWTATENALPADGPLAGPQYRRPVCVRLQSFARDGIPRDAYAYPLDIPVTHDAGCRRYAFGVVALCAMGNGSLWVLEREFCVPERRLKARTMLKIYEITLAGATPLHAGMTPEEMRGAALKKKPVAAFSTRMRLFRPKLANYEGLCEGMTLPDGRRTWLLVSDSQGGYGNRLCHLRDWIRVCVSPEKE